MANRDYPEVRSTKVVPNFQEKLNFDHLMDEDSNDIILITKDKESQSVTIKKVRRCNVCRKVPETNCICKQKSCSLRSNMSVVSKMSQVSFREVGEKVN